MSKIRAGVVGVGHMGRFHVSAYTEIIDVELVGVCDADAQRVAKVAEHYKTRGVTDYREMFGEVDVVSIAVPTELHVQVARDFLEAGIHVLLEKPIARSFSDAHELFTFAQEKDLVLQIGHVERFNGAINEIKKIVENPTLFESRRIGPFTGRNSDDGVVLDLLIHDIDIVLQLSNSPLVQMQAMGRSVVSGRDDLVTAQLRFENGCMAHLLASRVSEEKSRTLAVTQPGAYIFLDYTDQEIHIHRQASSEAVVTTEQLRYKQESIIERLFVYKGNPLKLELQHFIGCAMKGDEVRVSPEDELRSLRVALDILDGIGNAV
ncbi:MAG: Gfo/Idh/MocA family oxidoreductase [Candidatus Alcyoniella australis]|nr:Gfo/Idh/MocA family oxidoreductase [Candidatus Alcyoniella australis]